MKIKTSYTTIVLWLIYLFLLAVLLPHTAWAFRAFEPADSPMILGIVDAATVVSYVAALAFEAAIAVLTHKLSKHIEQTAKAAKSLKGLAKFSRQYVNAFSLGLLISTVVSSLANLAHAIEFGSTLKIFSAWGVPSELYAVAFGGILPFVSLLFARVLSNVNEAEGDEDPAVIELRNIVSELRRQMSAAKVSIDQANKNREAAEQRAMLAEDRFAAAGELMKLLVSEDKKERILAARRQWPSLPGSAIAIMTSSSPAYVSEIVKEYA